MPRSPKPQDWNKQLLNWYENSGKSIGEIQRETGIGGSTFRDYIHGRISNLSKMSPERRRALYDLTGLECFRYEEGRIEMPEPGRIKGKKERGYRPQELEEIFDVAAEGRKSIDRVVGEIVSGLRGSQRLRSGLLKAQQYRPTTEERTEAVMELLDILAEEVDYFRTAPEEEKRTLIERLQNEPESFGYVTQMLNIIYSGKKIDSWMLMAQPPSKIKRLTRNR